MAVFTTIMNVRFMGLQIVLIAKHLFPLVSAPGLQHLKAQVPNIYKQTQNASRQPG